MLKFGVPLALALLLGVFLFVGLQRDPSYVPSPLIGKQAPEFTLPSLHDPDYPVASKELAGKAWVLNVWGTWCGGCRQEHDTLMAIARTGAVPLIGLDWKDDRALTLTLLMSLSGFFTAAFFLSRSYVVILYLLVALVVAHYVRLRETYPSLPVFSLDKDLLRWPIISVIGVIGLYLTVKVLFAFV